MDLIVCMRTGTAPGAAHQSDGFPSFDLVTPLFQQFVIVSVAGFHTMTMIDYNGQAQQTFLAGKGNNAVGCGQDRRPLREAMSRPLCNSRRPVNGDLRYPNLEVTQDLAFPGSGRIAGVDAKRFC